MDPSLDAQKQNLNLLEFRLGQERNNWGVSRWWWMLIPQYNRQVGLKLYLGKLGDTRIRPKL